MQEFLGVSEQGLALLREYEGFIAKPYLCPAGKRTIGYGHVIKPNEQSFLTNITLEQAENLLRKDASLAAASILRLVKSPLKQCEGDALVSFVFNVGIGAFERSTMLRYLNQGKMKLAAKEFERWVYAQGQRLNGLVRRRAAEAALFARMKLD